MSLRDAPWWLIGGTEHCPFCLQRYALEVEVRCAGCDRGLCARCVARVEVREERYGRLGEEAWCPECAAEEHRAAGDAEAPDARSTAGRQDR